QENSAIFLMDSAELSARVIKGDPLRVGSDGVGQPPLDLPQGDLRVFPRGDVAPGADYFDWLAVLVVDKVPVVADPGVAAVLLAKPVLNSMAALLVQVAKLGLYSGEVVGMHAAPPEIWALQILVWLVAQQILYVVADECRPIIPARPKAIDHGGRGDEHMHETVLRGN